LLLGNPLRYQVRISLLSMTIVGGLVAIALSWIRISRLRGTLRALSGKHKRVSVSRMMQLARAPAQFSRGWVIPHCTALAPFVTPLRPSLMDWTTGITVGLLASLILATASLPLHVLIRHDFLKLIELAPRSVMQKLIAQSERARSSRERINRRMVAAMTMPVVLAAFGCTLIVNAHLRRADEGSRAESARVLARASLELSPGRLKGLQAALARAEELGFPAQLSSPDAPFDVSLESDGIAELRTPLQLGSARVRFSSSTVEVLSPAPVIVSLLAAVGAAVLGFLLGNVLSTDLYYATRGVRLLGTNPGLGATGAAVIQRARLRLVAELFEGIERLADRFSVFAQAQEAAIDARAAATRMRGMFFASVSHDLKGPLNSILGFTQLVFSEPLTRGQRESLEAIHSRAQELLALIETILDAARVEEGQLSLVSEEVPFGLLYKEALAKAAQLTADLPLTIYDEIEPNIPPLMLDRIRVTRALATLLAYSARTNKGGKMWLRAERETANRMRIDIDVPKPEHAPEELEQMLAPKATRGTRVHRGLALGLRLARSVVELHGGTVRVIDRGKKGAMFCVTLPTSRTPMPTASAPLHTIPPPPPGWDEEMES
jgi:signal transduction histidine kinase